MRFHNQTAQKKQNTAHIKKCNASCKRKGAASNVKNGGRNHRAKDRHLREKVPRANTVGVLRLPIATSNKTSKKI